jgi:DNA-binding NarL/FixJ family response regulator
MPQSIHVKRRHEDLNNDLKSLRRRVARLEKEKHLQTAIEKEKTTIEHSLHERVKELNCLYGLAELMERYGSSIHHILQGLTDLIPISWQYPEITCTKILFEGTEYKSSAFKTTRWRQVADIRVLKKKVGAIEVYYLRKMPSLDEGPFSKEERLLINSLAWRLGKFVERIQAEKQLEVERVALKNMNIALREVLVKVQDEKKEIGEAIQANVDKIILPVLHALETEVTPELKKYVALLKGNLEEIVSPFTSRLTKEFTSLTPAEIQICNMIKNGLTTKEIAQLRYISIATVSRHREHIRKKLNIANQKINLVTYLNTYMV